MFLDGSEIRKFEQLAVTSYVSETFVTGRQKETVFLPVVIVEPV